MHCDICKEYIMYSETMVHIQIFFTQKILCIECADNIIGLDKFLNMESNFSKTCFVCEKEKEYTSKGWESVQSLKNPSTYEYVRIQMFVPNTSDSDRSFWIHKECAEPSFMKSISHSLQ